MASSPRNPSNIQEPHALDAPSVNDEEQRRKKNHVISLRRLIFRCFLALTFSLFFFLLVSFSILYVAILVGNSSIRSPISVPAQCRIVSSSVDLRSSKVCELGVLNYKAKHVFYPFEKKKYRCHYDYYWASVFKVEYIDHSGQPRFALAEAPNEALPSNCRPNFGAAWLTKDKFKVNETYECWYTLGISKVNIIHEGLFDCQAKDPSTVEMLKRFSILSTRILKLWFASYGSISFFSLGSIRRWRWDVIAGLLTGFTTSLLSVTLIAFLRSFVSMIRRSYANRISPIRPTTILLKRVCWFVVYFSFMGWITIQYVKRLGFSLI